MESSYRFSDQTEGRVFSFIRILFAITVCNIPFDHFSPIAVITSLLTIVVELLNLPREGDVSIRFSSRPEKTSSYRWSSFVTSGINGSPSVQYRVNMADAVERPNQVAPIFVV